MLTTSTSLKTQFASLAYQEGLFSLTGNANKAGPLIEKYLKVFRESFAQKEPKYLDTAVGYDWCCAYVYYLLKQVGIELNIKPILRYDGTLGFVRTWYLWALQQNTFIPSSQDPEPGDLVLFDHLIEDVELDHIGIVIENKKGHILTSEGNYHNCSGIFNRDKDQRIRGYIRWS